MDGQGLEEHKKITGWGGGRSPLLPIPIRSSGLSTEIEMGLWDSSPPFSQVLQHLGKLHSFSTSAYLVSLDFAAVVCCSFGAAQPPLCSVTISLLGVHIKELKAHTWICICTPLFITELFKTAKIYK